MPTFISLQRWTPDGARTYGDTPARAERLEQLLDRLGGSLISVYWTMGPYDVIVVFNAPDTETASAAMLGLISGGNAQVVTLPAFDRPAMDGILARLDS